MKKQMKFSISCFMHSIMLTLVLGSIANAAGANPPEKGIRCYQKDKEIFRNDTPDINLFDGNSRGLKQVTVQDVPAQNARVYIYEPGQIVCFVKTK